MTYTHATQKYRHGFTLVEILVVIAIIAILAGILLSALGSVQESAKKTKAESLMQAFARACDIFALDHGRYPGILPESAVNGIQITSMQNALLELMGGARVKNSNSPNSVINEFDNFANGPAVIVENSAFFEDEATASNIRWDLAFDQNRFGEGPFIGGRQYEPYFSPKSADLLYAAYSNSDVPNVNDLGDSFFFPTLIDPWETPIMYFRSSRTSGPVIAKSDSDPNTPMPQFEIQEELQFFDPTDQIINVNGSLFGNDLGDLENNLAWLTLLLAHPSFWDIDESNADPDFQDGVAWGTARGRYMLLSAGQDTIFLEKTNQPVDDAGEPISNPYGGEITPSMMNDFDDVIVHGGA
ncbi:MAG: prepilin-type N-terminal cleavage/methylation domain-containing protein [Planctomycetes bacterium]|nr:prepilin-type N-terminal cleavage/methylation domain-containing protein [Planctomycetota bacterium]MBL6998178.1 prepilin-type N-terminal cleavage/methylation domain-containing protein [Phycisphaerales bacterium]